MTTSSPSPSWLARKIPLDAREWRVLTPLALVGFFLNYDTGLLTLAGPTIADGLGVDIDEFGAGVAVIRLGSLGSLITLGLADRLGRRTLLLVSVVGFTLATGATAMAIGLATFVACQFVARIWLATEEGLAGVVLTEELDPAHRGLGQSLLGALAMSGFGVVALVILAVPHVWGGWRALYLVALLPLAAVLWLRRNLDETEAFEVAKAEGRTERTQLAAMTKPLWARLGATTLVFAVEGFVTLPALFYAASRAEDEFDWTAQMTAVILISGIWTLLGWILGGRVSDLVGRKPMLFVGFLAGGLALPALFLGGTGWFRVGFFLAAAAASIFAAARGAYLGELFPTEVRSTATAVVQAVTIAAGSAGLLVAGALPGGPSDIPLMSVALIPALALLAWLPETVGIDVVSARRAHDPDDVIDLTVEAPVADADNAPRS